MPQLWARRRRHGRSTPKGFAKFLSLNGPSLGLVSFSWPMQLERGKENYGLWHWHENSSLVGTHFQFRRSPPTPLIGWLAIRFQVTYASFGIWSSGSS